MSASSGSGRQLARIFTVVFVILLAIAVGEYWRARSLPPYIGQQAGLVTLLQEKVGHSRNGWKDGVEASLVIAGHGYTINTLSAHGRLHLGDSVNIIYDSRDPGHSLRIGVPGDIWSGVVFQFIIAGFVGFFVLMGWVVIISGERANAGVSAGRSLS